ncbi:MAG: extracellular solute-binding protein [Lachnospiraceae bacterium]|nr:extracellular solute-binding protein [Lachnospiraceae bacterium]
MNVNKTAVTNGVKICLLIMVPAIIAVCLILSLFAPHSLDTRTAKGALVYEDKAYTGTEGIIYSLTSKTSDSKIIESKFDIEKEDDYEIFAGYMTLDEKSREPEFSLLIDNVSVSDEASVTLCRVFSDTGDFKKTAAGDEIRPMQSEVHILLDEPFRIGMKDRVKLHLSKGTHTIRLESLFGECEIKYIRLYKENAKPYSEYLNEIKDINEVQNTYIQIEAETPYLKSSSEVNDTFDRSSPYSVPYNPTCIRYNTIGGTNWKEEGQWAEWQIEVPKTGLYRLGMRFRQNENKGRDSLRRLSIDGIVPFSECENLSFAYNVNWQSDFFGNDDSSFLFYLTKGTHIVRLETVLADKKAMADAMTETLSKISDLYRQIIMITGTDPDIYRDYALETAIPDLIPQINDILADMQTYSDKLTKESKNGGYAARVILQVITQLKDFTKKPYTIAKRLSVFKTNIAALAEWILEFETQPLQIDYLYICGSDTDTPAAEGGFFSKMGHEVRAFVGSFGHSYNEVASETENTTGVTLNVWMGRGRDQANVVKRLIDSYFTPETGIGVNISLVEGALVKATLAGMGPDVNIFTSRGEAMNLAFRGALTDLDDTPGFNELKTQYMDSAFVPYTYNDAIYAIPESQEFYVMYIRTDIFESLGLKIPETWQDVMALLPVLQANNMAIGLPYTDGYATMGNGIGTINLFPTLLSQKGIDIYRETPDGTKTNLNSGEAFESFKQWSDFYVKYDFDFYKDDFNRFRTGEMPIIISSYGLYNNFSQAAPEISGSWVMTLIPGTYDKSGNLNRATCAGGSCSILLKNCKDEDAAVKFINWWNSANTQAMYARDIEAELSTLGRYTPANIKAFENSMWNESEKELLKKQWESVVEVPEIPGGYYVSRNIDNAMRQVYYNGENARDTFNYWMNSVEEELMRKQQQLKARKEKDR